MAPEKVVLAGATGNVGVPILEALLAADNDVVVLTRKGSDSTSKLPKHPKLTIKQVDYTSVAELTEAVKGAKVVVSTLATASVAEQTPLIEASIAAGVQRFIPSEFGSNTLNPHSAALPVFGNKVATAEYLKSKAAQNPAFTYTLVITGAFFDWGMRMGFLIDPAKHTANLYNGGDVLFSASTLPSIGTAVAGVVAHLPETANRAVYVYDALVSQNQLIGYAKEKDGQEWSLTPKDSEKIRTDGLAELAKGPAPASIGPIMVGFIISAIFNPDFGGNFRGFDDNALLGVKVKSEGEIKALVHSLM